MSYEQAPATKMLATHCIFCSRPLVDAASVEAGIGPHCRSKVGYNDPVSDSARKEANKLIHQIATDRRSVEVKTWLGQIESLGLGKLATKLKEALADVKIEELNGRLWVEAPYLDGVATKDWRRIPGRIFDRDTKRNTVPSEQRVAVFQLLKKYYPGVTALGPKGLFQL